MTSIKFMTYTTFSLGLMGSALYRKHLIAVLLCLEGLMVALFSTLALISQTLITTTTMTQPITLLTFSACAAGTGLALLVATARTHASDHLKTLNLLAC
uniref:NADH-ubiquinone oxidoreductase chain 4L n=1 Tax=Stenodactylus petrii TaxID=401535 RepID=A0A0A1H9Y4_9SAUR|nr:NADH dehydrogenase subunit 4L [Stenodactylus petrii]